MEKIKYLTIISGNKKAKLMSGQLVALTVAARIYWLHLFTSISFSPLSLYLPNVAWTWRGLSSSKKAQRAKANERQLNDTNTQHTTKPTTHLRFSSARLMGDAGGSLGFGMFWWGSYIYGRLYVCLASCSVACISRTFSLLCVLPFYILHSTRTLSFMTFTCNPFTLCHRFSIYT